MSDFYIFDLAVYRRTEEEYYADRDQSTARRLDASGLSRERSPDSYRNAEEAFKDSYGGPWEFNQVVGWIRLYVEASHVGAHLWWVNAKRLQSKMRKTFYLTTPSNILATSFPPGVVSAEIFSDTLTHLEKLAKEKPLKGRYLDLGTFRNIGPFINWRELLNNAASRRESGLIKFFVPAVTDDQQAEDVWQATKKFAIHSLG